MKYIKWTILAIFLPMLLLTGCQSDSSKGQIQNGIINLTGWNFNEDGTVPLDGKWEFYWEQLLSPDDDFTKASLTGYYTLPTYWTNYENHSFPSKGYATYRLLIKLDHGKQMLSLSTPDIYTEYKLWVNGSLIDRNMPGKNQDPAYLCPKINEFYAESNQLEIILQIQNNQHIYAGVGQSILLGDFSAIHTKENVSFALDFFLIGICFISALYHLAVFLLRKKGMETLYFSILCFSVGLWTMFFNESLIMRLFPALPFSIGSRVVTMTIPFCVISMTLYTLSLYREDISKIAVRVIVLSNLLYIAMIVLCKPYTYLQLFIPYLFGVALVCLYGLYISLRIAIKKRPEYLYYICGIAFLVIGCFINILEYLRTIELLYFLPYSVVLFIFVQILLLGKRYLNATRNVDRLSFNLQESLYKIEDTETAFLNAQIKPHFLYNTLNTIAQCCQSDPEEAESLILYLSKYLRGTLNFENLGKLIPLKRELESVSAYYHIEKARFENIQVEFLVDETLKEYSIPPLVLQPLVENAIKHGIRNKENDGLVWLKITRNEAFMVCTIEDNGIGIDEERLPELLTKPINKNSIGLYNIHTRLLRFYGKGLSIRSTIGVGTVVQFEIPL